MKKTNIALSAIATALLLPLQAQITVHVEEDFEIDGGGFNNFTAYDYSAGGALVNPTGGTQGFLNDGSTNNYPDIATVGEYELSWDFATIGATTNRSMSFSLRNDEGNGNTLSIAVGASGDDSLNIYDGGWQTVGSGGEILDDTWYRITLRGSLQPTGTYDISVIDLNNSNNEVLNVTGLSYYHTTPDVDEGSAYLEYRNEGTYAVDNFYFASVPEPSTLALVGGAFGVMVCFRRFRRK